jgi:hypothetical protein
MGHSIQSTVLLVLAIAVPSCWRWALLPTGPKPGPLGAGSVRGESQLGRAFGVSEVAESQTEPPSGAASVIFLFGMPIPARG